jgi:DeoR/GlpR family transcriptional regulator of sugar metabolism
VIERSQESYIIADFSKFDNTSFIKVAGFDSITGIITDKELSLKWHDKFA